MLFIKFLGNFIYSFLQKNLVFTQRDIKNIHSAAQFI